MKRTPLKRKTPLKRSPMHPRTRKKSAYKMRERDTERMLWIKTQPCAVRRLAPLIVLPKERYWYCYGDVEADHAGCRPVGRKADDDTVIPLCHEHHDQRQCFRGVFKGWKKADMRGWLSAMIAFYQLAWKDEQARRKAQEEPRE